MKNKKVRQQLFQVADAFLFLLKKLCNFLILLPKNILGLVVFANRRFNIPPPLRKMTEKLVFDSLI
jgi:hypothetical protein